MKVVKTALKEKGLTEAELPQELQVRIENLKELIVKFNETADDYDQTEEEDKEIEKKLDEMENFIAQTDVDIANAIRNYTPAPADPNPAPPAEQNPEPKKKDGGFGWLIFGGLVLVATVGAVNILKKR